MKLFTDWAKYSWEAISTEAMDIEHFIQEVRPGDIWRLRLSGDDVLLYYIRAAHIMRDGAQVMLNCVESRGSVEGLKARLRRGNFSGFSAAPAVDNSWATVVFELVERGVKAAAFDRDAWLGITQTSNLWEVAPPYHVVPVEELSFGGATGQGHLILSYQDIVDKLNQEGEENERGDYPEISWGIQFDNGIESEISANSKNYEWDDPDEITTGDEFIAIKETANFWTIWFPSNILRDEAKFAYLKAWYNQTFGEDRIKWTRDPVWRSAAVPSLALPEPQSLVTLVKQGWMMGPEKHPTYNRIREKLVTPRLQADPLRDRRLPGAATRVRWNKEHQSVPIRYHNTDVVTFYPGFVLLQTGGWESVTTKARMNEYLGTAGIPAHIYQRRYTWYLSKGYQYSGANDVAMEEGTMILDYDGNVLANGRDAVEQYIEQYLQSLPQDEPNE